MLFLNYILITASLHGLRILIQLIILSFYKKKLFELYTLTPTIESEKNFILKFLDKANLGNT